MGQAFERIDWLRRSARWLNGLLCNGLRILGLGAIFVFGAVMMGGRRDRRFCTLKTAYSKGFSPPQSFRSSNLRLH
jgi:hypothetical protein